MALNLAIGACSHTSPSTVSPVTVPISTIGSGMLADENHKTPGGIWIADKAQMEALASRMHKNVRIPNKAGVLPEIDFTANGVLLIWMGLQPSGGYALELMADRAAVEDHTAVVPVRWIEPPKGAMVIQMLTNPYLMIRLAKGKYDTIRVIDGNGVARIRIDVKADSSRMSYSY